MVAELEVAPDAWEAIFCERPPQKLLDDIMKHRLEFYTATGRLIPEDVQKLIPMTFPVTHLLDPTTFPGCERFPIDDWIRQGKPYFSLASWIALCEKICDNDMDNLSPFFRYVKRVVRR